MKKIYEFKNARLWKSTNEADEYDYGQSDTFYVEGLGFPYVLAFTADYDDGYRSHLYVDEKLKRLEFVMIEEKELVGEFPEVKVFHRDGSMIEKEEEDEDSYLYDEMFDEYKIYSKGEQIASAYSDHSDQWYPSGSIELYGEDDFQKEIEKAEKEFTYEHGEFFPVKNKRAIIVIGEPRTGKTTTLAQYGEEEMQMMDSDGSAQRALNWAERTQNDVFFVIGKFRHTHVTIEGEKYLYKDAAAHIFQERGFDVYELEFIERKGPEYEEYAVIVENQTNIELSEMFQPLVVEQNGELPETSYIHARLSKK